MVDAGALLIGGRRINFTIGVQVPKEKQIIGRLCSKRKGDIGRRRSGPGLRAIDPNGIVAVVHCQIRSVVRSGGIVADKASKS